RPWHAVHLLFLCERARSFMDSETTTSPIAPPRLSSPGATPDTPAGTTPPPIGLSAASVSISAAPERGEAALPAGEARLSYKFQRLREKLRTAIDTGELA